MYYYLLKLNKNKSLIKNLALTILLIWIMKIKWRFIKRRQLNNSVQYYNMFSKYLFNNNF